MRLAHPCREPLPLAPPLHLLRRQCQLAKLGWDRAYVALPWAAIQAIQGVDLPVHLKRSCRFGQNQSRSGLLPFPGVHFAGARDPGWMHGFCHGQLWAWNGGVFSFGAAAPYVAPCPR